MDKRALYACKWPDDEDYHGVVMWVHMHGKELWFLTPPDRGHMIKGEVLREREDGFTFLSKGAFPGEWDFQLVTLENFREGFYRLVIDGKQIADSVHSTEDLHEWFRKQFPE